VYILAAQQEIVMKWHDIDFGSTPELLLNTELLATHYRNRMAQQ